MSNTVTYDERVANARGVWAKFQTEQTAIKGETNPDAVVLRRNSRNIEPQSAFLVCYRFGDAANNYVGGLSHAVDELVGGLVYDHRNAHATITDPRLRAVVELPDGDPQTNEVLRWLREAAETAVSQTPAGAELYIDFGVDGGNGVLTNGEVILVAGLPSPALDELSRRVVEQASAYDDLPGLKLPWGYHLTVSRFTGNYRREAAEVDQLLDLMERQPVLGRQYPTAIEVGYFNTNPEAGFVWDPHYRVDFTRLSPAPATAGGFR